jgi:hypothetical protein
MAAAMKAQKTGLLELRVTVDRWIRVLATLTEETLTVSPGEVAEEPVKPNPTPAGDINGDPANLSSFPVPETITNVKRTVRVTKQDVGGLGISIKGRFCVLRNQMTLSKTFIWSVFFFKFNNVSYSILALDFTKSKR